MHTKAQATTRQKIEMKAFILLEKFRCRLLETVLLTLSVN